MEDGFTYYQVNVSTKDPDKEFHIRAMTNGADAYSVHNGLVFVIDINWVGWMFPLENIRYINSHKSEE